MGNILRSLFRNNISDIKCNVDDRLLHVDNDSIDIVETVKSPLEYSYIKDEIKLTLDIDNKKSSINYMQNICKCNECNCENCDCSCKCCK